MNLTLNDILHLSPEEISNSKIELNMDTGSGGQAFLDRWLKHDEIDKANGTCEDCSCWGWQGGRRNFRQGEWVFSFARISADEWLFLSAVKITELPINDWAKRDVLERFKPLFGRLIIKCNKGSTRSRYVFWLSTYLEQAIVKEVLPCLYSGEKFEGYDRVHLPYRRLADIFDKKILPTYYEALSKITGVYCLTDTDTGKLYIGSATGEGGVLQRWGNYLDSKHGGNKKLIALHDKEGDEYFEKYFTFTLLEYFTLSYDRDKILEREQYWKRCFDTIKNGYNDN